MIGFQVERDGEMKIKVAVVEENEKERYGFKNFK